MPRLLPLSLCVLALCGATVSATQPAAPRQLRIIVFGAHPDDAELQAAGVAAMWSAKGHKVKFVAATNGDIGHFSQAGGPLAIRRTAEVKECARILGITTDVLDIHDGELVPNLETRRAFARKIREWQADIVIGHRPYDYHPDHRNVGVLLNDTAVVVGAPFFVPDTPPTAGNPIYLNSADGFADPKSFCAHRRGGHRRGRREEIPVRRRDAVAVCRCRLVAGAHAAEHAHRRGRSQGLHHEDACRGGWRQAPTSTARNSSRAMARNEDRR